MARRKKVARPDTPPPEEIERRFRLHLRALGLASAAEYKAWCRDHGFSPKTDKSAPQRERERRVAERHAVQARLAQARRDERNPKSAIAYIFSGAVKPGDFLQEKLYHVHQAYVATKTNRRAKRALRDLLLHLKADSPFFDHRPAIGHLGMLPGNTFLEGLTALALQVGSWLRPIDEWKPRSHNPRRQFASLARHLLAEYDVPAFFDQVWFRGTSDLARDQQQWFIHVARGHNLRTAGLPIPLTKRMAHHCLQAPGNYTVEAALRWGQIHGLGGDARLAEAVRGTRLCESFEHDEFWTTVLRFLIAQPMLDTVHIGPIIDYLHEQRFVPQNAFVAPGVMEEQPPAQPHLSMKGRSADSLLVQVRRWHRQLGREASHGLQWPKSGIGGFSFLEGSSESGNQKRWTIRELLSAGELSAEGRAMRHCVASYAGSCARRTTAIWTLEVESFAGRAKVLTIEVRPAARTISQARGKYNARPDEKSRSILRRWAAQEGLTVASYV